MWFIGGACLNPVKGINCLAPSALQGLRNVPVLGLLFPYDNWNSLMYFVAPLVGFVLAFFLINWLNSFFETREAAGIGFLFLILIALFFGYYLNLSFYVGEMAVLNSRGAVKYSLYFCIFETDYLSCNQVVSKINQEFINQAQENQAQTIKQLIPVSYWVELRKSIYLLFILGAISGWLPLFGREIYKKYRESN
jgi:biotin transporter BioY